MRHPLAHLLDRLDRHLAYMLPPRPPLVVEDWSRLPPEDSVTSPLPHSHPLNEAAHRRGKRPG